jgi:hypothetical protein
MGGCQYVIEFKVCAFLGKIILTGLAPLSAVSRHPEAKSGASEIRQKEPYARKSMISRLSHLPTLDVLRKYGDCSITYFSIQPLIWARVFVFIESVLLSMRRSDQSGRRAQERFLP